ncbi:MAG: hypothetical protein VZQ98_03670 [Bacteroidales bacterium]|nr:hypothetical protein [Bacteroidales bacterium]
MEERINQALAQIESDLRNIQSAREQVDNVVLSSSHLQEKVRTFVLEVSNLSQQVEKMADFIAGERNNDVERVKETLNNLHNSCKEFVSRMETTSEKILSQFDDSCADVLSSLKTESSNIASDFNKKATKSSNAINSNVQALYEEVEKLDNAKKEMLSAIGAIKDLKNIIENLMLELQKSQSAQDEVLINIKDAVATSLLKVEKINNTQKIITDNQTSQNSILNQLTQSLNASNTALSGISPLIQSSQNAISKHLDSFETQMKTEMKNIQMEYKNGEETLKKKFSILQIMLAISLLFNVIVIAMQVLR